MSLPQPSRQSNLDLPTLPTVDSVGGISQAQPDGTPPFGEPVLYPVRAIDPGNPWDSVTAIYRDQVMIDHAAEESVLHHQIHDALGQATPATRYPLTGKERVNPTNPGIPNLGPPNRQANQSGHTSIIVHNASAEQGWGLDPAILVPRFPRATGDNRYYARLSGYRRNGSMDVVVAPPQIAVVTQGARMSLFARLRQTSTVHGALADVAPSVPWSSNQPIGPSIFVNTLPPDVEAIYG